MWPVISALICGIITTIEVIYFFKIVLNEPIKINRKKLLVIGIICSILYALIYLYFKGTIKTLIIFLINIFMYKKIFNLTMTKTIFLTFLWMIILVIPDILEILVITKILNQEQFYYNYFAGSITSNLIILVSFMGIVYILRKILRKIIKTKIDTNIKIVFLTILTFICVAMLVHKTFKIATIDIVIIANIFAIIVFVTILFSLIKQTIENQKLSNEYDKLIEFMTTYENEIENQRILRHEIKNEFRTIRAKICDKQANKEIIEYIDEIVNDKYEIKQEKYAKFGYLPPNGIKGLCYFKTQEAEKKGITISINISKRIKESSLYKLNIKNQRDFGRILGVFLDNAIEASEETEKKQIGIEAYSNSEKEFKMIITNTYKNKIDKNKIGKESYSTKGKNRGHGLLLVKHLIEKSEIFEVKTNIQDDIYSQTIIIKKL